jgi:hypothetical protein
VDVAVDGIGWQIAVAGVILPIKTRSRYRAYWLAERLLELLQPYHDLARELRAEEARELASILKNTTITDYEVVWEDGGPR